MQARKVAWEALEKIFSEMGVSAPDKLTVEEPRNAAHGDLSLNAALLLAKTLGQKPAEIAARIAKRIPELAPQIEIAEVAGPGFCNLFFRKNFWRDVIRQVEEAGENFGHNDSLRDRRALVEYVSANPTGPLHVGHGRGAALGDAIARILRACGAETATEYYLNDAGSQMARLGLSIWLRMQELFGRRDPKDFPKDCYQGQYIIDLARELARLEPGVQDLPEDKGLARCRQYGIDEILAGIKKDLADFRCEHQSYFSEKSLVEDGSVAKVFKTLTEVGDSYEADGAVWFRVGSDQDRVLRKSDGSLTYFATDIAYHKNKFERGYNLLIDIWGADHHGYISRMRGAIKSVGEDPNNFEVLLVQMVNLLEKSKKISMSTRAGKFETLAQVLEEVGADAARFMFLSRSADSPLDFDLDLARQRTMDNPVYYVQYAHARISALLRRAALGGIALPEHSDSAFLQLLDNDDELALLRKIAAFEDTVEAAGKNLAPQYIGAYLMDLAGRIHSYYAKYPVLGQEAGLTLARLVLLRAAGQVLRNGLNLLGVSAPENM